MSAQLRTRYGTRAAITGAAAGIGEAFALALAARRFDLLLLDRDEAGLERAASAARAEGVDVRTCRVDLLTDEGRATALAALADPSIGLFVSNAGTSELGAFVDVPLEAHLRTLSLNCEAPLHLVHAVARRLAAAGRGGLVLLSSSSGVIHAPYVAHYAATKAWALALGEALHEELRPRGVDVLVVVPGLTRTPGLGASGVDEAAASPLLQDATTVAEGALARLGRVPRFVSNPRDRLGALVLGVLPRRMALRLNARTMRRFFPSLRTSD